MLDDLSNVDPVGLPVGDVVLSNGRLDPNGPLDMFNAMGSSEDVSGGDEGASAERASITTINQPHLTKDTGLLAPPGAFLLQGTFMDSSFQFDLPRVLMLISLVATNNPCVVGHLVGSAALHSALKKCIIFSRKLFLKDNNISLFDLRPCKILGELRW